MIRKKYFSDSYQEARLAFIMAAENAGATLNSYVLPLEKAPDGSPLTVDTAWIGPQDANVVVLCVSGTHGPEGFCGSAAQIQSLTDGSVSDLPKGVSVLMVHALNPFGFAYMTRYNENNVDLNRNWIDFNAPIDTPPLYAELHAVLPPEDQFNDTMFGETLGAFSVLIQEYGGFAIENALSAGQYAYPTGIGYGGNKFEWSSGIMKKILAGLDTNTRHIAYLDWHSLVRSGTDDMVYLCFNQPKSELFERCKSWWGAENVDPECVDQKWNAGLGREGGRPARSGIMMWGVQESIAPNQDVVGGVIEFTDEVMDPLKQKVANLKAMLLSRHFVHTRDVLSLEGRKLYAESRELWSPTRGDWQEKSLKTAQNIFQKTLAGAAEWAREDISK
jgi:hypothetical protein